MLDNQTDPNRLIVLDGIRAFASMGVLYIHCWLSFGNPAFMIFNFNIAKVLALGGNGVDLFFALSGFLMYYIYGNKRFEINRFSLKRWRRLSPAFYVASIAYILFELYHHSSFPVFKSFLTSFFYLNNIFPSYSSSGLFWTLGVEAQYYLIFILFIILQKKLGFTKACLSLSALLLLIVCFVVLKYKSNSDQFTNLIIFRFFEFLAGMITAKIYMNKRSTWNAFYFLPFILITYVGRFLISKQAIELNLDYGSFIKLAGFIVMGCGFSGIIYVALCQKNWLNTVFKAIRLTDLGKISYSFYLWHGILLVFVNSFVVTLNRSAVFNVWLSFGLSLLIVIPVSKLSYKYLEQPFLK